MHPPPLLFLVFLGIEGGFDVEQELYEEDVKVVILPDRQEVTSEDLATMPDVVRERVRFCLSSGEKCFIIHSHCHMKQNFTFMCSSYIM